METGEKELSKKPIFGLRIPIEPNGTRCLIIGILEREVLSSFKNPDDRTLCAIVSVFLNVFSQNLS